jgi:Protein of unknown function (DUF3619)
MSMNHTKNNQEDLPTELDAQAKQIAGLLDNHANRLSMRTFKQLETARENAVKAHAQQKISGTSVNADGTISQLSAWVGHHRMMSMGLLAGAILVGFMMMQSMNQRNSDRNMERGDAFLLSAELPPEAFVDRGFEPSLNFKQAKL